VGVKMKTEFMFSCCSLALYTNGQGIGSVEYIYYTVFSSKHKPNSFDRLQGHTSKSMFQN